MVPNRSACGVLVLGAVIASVYVGKSDAQDDWILSDKINTIRQVKGPVTYKSPSDLIEILGFVTEQIGDSANFQDCKGTVRKVKVSDLHSVKRKCTHSPSTGIWVLNSIGKDYFD